VSEWTTASPWGRLGLNRVLRPVHAALIRWEFRADQRLVDGMAPEAADLRGMHLGPGDRALAATRARLRRIYRRAP
jgi:hypothetical protein